jgi:hypothetical protein
MSHSLKRRNTMNEKELIAFIVFAKKNGYANKEGATEIIKYEKSGAVKIIVRRGDWEYTDKYIGTDSFLGSEVVLFEGKPVWGMSYHGRIIAKNGTEKNITSFLKLALLEVDQDKPYRGPEFFKNEKYNFTYINISHGNLNFFSGEEMISEKDVGEAYELRYIGGAI